MITADIISGLALIVSAGTFFYTIHVNNQSTVRNLKKDQSNYLKSLTRLVKTITFSSSPEFKENTLDSLREELTFCTYFDNNLSFQEFSLNLDDNVYVLCNSQTEYDFNSIKDTCISDIRNFGSVRNFVSIQ